MTFKGHLAASPVLLLLAPAIGFENALAAACSSFIIDIDHVHILIKERAFSFAKIRKINERIHNRLIGGQPNRAYVDILYLFHTVEFNLLLWALSAYWPFLRYVSIGFIYHMAFDAAHHYVHRLPLNWLLLSNWLRYELKSDKAPLPKLSE